MKTNANSTASLEPSTHAADFAERIRMDQVKLTSELRPYCDFIVSGSGSSSSVTGTMLEGADLSGLSDVTQVRQ
jgi:choline dehydrogenase